MQEDRHDATAHVVMHLNFQTDVPRNMHNPRVASYFEYIHESKKALPKLAKGRVVKSNTLVEDVSAFIDLCEYDFSVDAANKVDISGHCCTGSYRPATFTTNDEAIFSSLSLFVMRAPFNQCMALFNYNERSVIMEKFIEKELHGVLSSPWIENVTTDMMFDSSCPITMTFFCVERPSNTTLCRDLAAAYKVVNVDDRLKTNDASMRLKFNGVSVRTVTDDDLQECFRRFNIAPPGYDSLREGVVNFFHYLCGWKFNSIDAIEEFCHLHTLPFFVCRQYPFNVNVMCFRQFLNVYCPIKLSPVDGQHRMISTICAYEWTLLTEVVPMHHLIVPPSKAFPSNSHIFDKGKITWMFSDDLANLRQICKDHSIRMNRSGSNFIEGDFMDKIARKLDSLNDSTGQVEKRLIKHFHDNRFFKPSKAKSELRDIGGKLVNSQPSDFHKHVQYPFAVFVFQTAMAQKRSPIPTTISWTPDHPKKIFEAKCKSLLDVDHVIGWDHRAKSSYFPNTFAAFVEPLLHCHISPSITDMFFEIYDQKCFVEQVRLIPQSRRPAGHVFKCEDHNLWCFLEFFYHGFQRPVDYLVHLLTEFVVMFTYNLRMFKDDKLLKKRFDRLKQQHSSKLWKLLPKIIDPPCYWSHLMKVDDHHFPGMYEPNTPFHHLSTDFSNGLNLDPSSISAARDPSPAVEAYLASKPIKGKVPLDRNGYTRFSLAVREAVYKQILPVIAEYGMNPKVEFEVDKKTLQKLSR